MTPKTEVHNLSKEIRCYSAGMGELISRNGFPWVAKGSGVWAYYKGMNVIKACV